MSVVASTNQTRGDSTLVRAAARGELPSWAEVTPARYRHMERVATLMGQWATGLGLSASDRERWLAAAWLHDSLRDADAEALRGTVPEPFRRDPGPLLHGPAAAERLSGIVDEEVEAAIRFHTIGHSSLTAVGKALFLADFLEPGRDFSTEWRASLRERMPHDMDAVLIEVLEARIRHLLERRKPIRPETAAFWTAVVAEDR